MNTPHKVLPTDAPAAAPVRRSSFQVIMSELEQASPTTVMSRQITSRLSFNKDYRRLNTTEERVKACVRTYTAEVLSVHGTRESTLSFSEQTVFDFMERQKSFGLSDLEVHLAWARIAYLQVVEKAEYNPYRILSLFFKTMMGYVDLATDVATMAYYATVNPMVAAVQGGILAFSFVCQCVFSIALGQPLWVGLMGLIGMKPALEAWRDATGAEAFKGQKLGSDQMMWICRGVEMVVSAGVG
jgi:hypothetical protein